MNLVEFVAKSVRCSRSEARRLLKGGAIRLGSLDAFSERPPIVNGTDFEVPDGQYCFKRGKDPVDFAFVSLEGTTLRVHDLTGFEKHRWIDDAIEVPKGAILSPLNHANHPRIMEALRIWAEEDYSPELVNRYLKILNERET